MKQNGKYFDLSATKPDLSHLTIAEIYVFLTDALPDST